MLKEISIKNFLSHKSSLLKFHPRINAITGESLAGKSAIKRAVELLATYRPSGFRFKNWYAGKKAVEVIAKTDSNTISLTKTKSRAVYKLDEEEFRRFGKKVPEEISRALRMGDINFQGQFDSPFLITSSASEIAKAINKIIRIENVARWVSILNSEINGIKKIIANNDSLLEEYQEELDGYKGFHKVKATINLIDAFDKDISKRYKTLTGIMDLIDIVDTRSEVIEVYTKRLNAVKDPWEQIEKLTYKLINLREKEKLLKEVVVNNARIYNSKEQKQFYLSEYIDLIKKEKICPYCLSDIDDEAVEKIKEAL